MPAAPAASDLNLAGDLRVPVDIVTETLVIFGKRGSGKTTTGTVLAEELIGAGLPVGILDPKGDWWGLRSSADGKGAGLPVLIFGGEHADLPLPPGSGTVVADLLVAEQVPMVFDMKLMSKTQQRTFVTDFMERLYLANRDPLHLIVDEADRFAPQREAVNPRLLGAYEDIVLRGRGLGIGCTSITLRPAALNSAIRSQVEILIAMKMLGKLDVQAVDEWVRLHATDEEARILKASLPSLPTGSAWFWSPGWLEILKLVQVRPRLTFDSSATPKVGQQRIVPRQFAPVNQDDVARLSRLLAPPEPAKAPAGGGEVARLTGEVSRLRRQLAEATRREPERVEVPVLAAGDIAALEQAVAGLRDITVGVELALSRVTAQAAPRPARPQAAPERPASREATAGVTLGKAQRAILTVLARFPEGRDKRPVAILAGYAVTSGHFGNAISDLRRAGLIEPGMPLKITPAGIAVTGSEPLPEGPALVSYWMGQLGKAEREVLRALLNVYPATLTRQEVAERTGYAATSGHFGNALSRLRSLQLIDGLRDMKVDETLAWQAVTPASGS